MPYVKYVIPLAFPDMPFDVPCTAVEQGASLPYAHGSTCTAVHGKTVSFPVRVPCPCQPCASEPHKSCTHDSARLFCACPCRSQAGTKHVRTCYSVSSAIGLTGLCFCSPNRSMLNLCAKMQAKSTSQSRPTFFAVIRPRCANRRT